MAGPRLFGRLRHSGRGAGFGRRIAAPLLAACLALFGQAQGALADAAVSMEGAGLRLVAEPPSADGVVRAALLVDLEPGWKTYWLDPGDAGIPPRLDLYAGADLQHLDAQFPLPHRLSEPYGASNVYSQPFAVALTLRRSDAPEAGKPATIDLSLTLGLCRDICIPASARLTLDIAAIRPADARLVAYAFEALPEPSTGEVGIQSARLGEGGGAIEVDAAAPSDRPSSETDLFLAGPAGWFFGAPGAPKRDGRRLTFTVPVLGRPKAAGEAPPPGVDAVLSLGAHAFRAENIPVSAPR
ncbi:MULTISPECIES: protein-disulfide reductase DsbD domain-containing protein [unclassified Aureimonas]|uniref:protein-disulfide reductase DsbD domain-containing protein n=1 Tax=unclassified Aureimonas TaxID=2615206 RepID=UPI0006F49B47|nr:MULTISPECIES: protein-disulfide reductase DsbD domain-containing protein [unclassified Aureimonas]KQT65094.1 hypothetical protein ASG62_22080 [Aureimonas sp. Leaf427]KQT76257.1 hypothetical protein ASG54_16095 [Aureimonas sp. Leaf460]